MDGISDQSLPAWDSGFSGSYFRDFFLANWVAPAHIQYARYVVQWNIMAEGSAGPNPNGDYREKFEAWLNDVAGMGLTADVALTSYNGVYPSSSTEYKTRLKEILDRAAAIGHPVRYLEAWNEPNNQGGLWKEGRTAVTAAEYTNQGYGACEEQASKCTLIAGSLEDNPEVATYEKLYIEHLHPVPTIWGVHPYYSVEYMTEAPYVNFLASLPSKGAGDQIWFTEIAARQCAPSKNNGETGQAERANWLVNTLMRTRKPEHVFYYELLLKGHQQPSCSSEPEDGALYVPSNDPNAEDRPRAAASFIWGGKRFPWEYWPGVQLDSFWTQVTDGTPAPAWLWAAVTSSA